MLAVRDMNDAKQTWLMVAEIKYYEATPPGLAWPKKRAKHYTLHTTP